MCKTDLKRHVSVSETIFLCFVLFVVVFQSSLKLSAAVTVSP